MIMSQRSRIAVAATFLAVTAMPVGLASAQDTGAGADAGQQSQDRNTRAQDLQDFVHYTLIAKPDLAKAHLERLLNSGITDAELVELIDETMERQRFDEAVRKARYIESMGDVVAELESRARFGELNLSRDPKRIEQAIQMLKGHLRQQRMAEEFLIEAGEYAVPFLLKQVTGGTDPVLRQKALDMLERIGVRAVAPLNAALLALDDQSQAKIAALLGRIGFSTSTPYLAELASGSSRSAAAAREAASNSLRNMGGGEEAVPALYAIVARRYMLTAAGLTPYPDDDINNIWSYDSHGGLIPVTVPTAIYGDVMAMILSRKALQMDPSNASALATFIAADLSRENHLAQGESDPVFGDSQYSADFYALGAGPNVMQQVLAIAIDSSDTALARDAIRALQKTAGNSNLFGGSSRLALLEALTYPDRRVRYDAALALGKASPTGGFNGDFAVVPLLASAVRAADASYALVIADEAEDARVYADWLNALGYTVVAQAGSLADAQEPVARAAGIDLVVLRQGPAGTTESVRDLRTLSKTSVAPVVVLTTSTDVANLERQFSSDRRVQVKAASPDESAFASIIEEAVQSASGPRMSEAEAMAFSFEAIGTLADIAISNNAVYNINDAQSALIDALQIREGAIRLKIAEVLSYVDSDAAQKALFDAALTASGPDQIELLGRVADSAKRFGDRADERHLQQLLALVQQGGEVGEAAAAVHGGLNLPTANVVQIIAD